MPDSNGSPARDAGFTLVEVMIALVVLAVAGLGVISAFTTSERAGDMIEQEVAVDNAIRERLADIQADAQDDLTAFIQEFTSSADAGLFEVHSVRLGLLSPVEGRTAVCQVFLHLQEGTVPREFGGGGDGIDLDGDGIVSSDNLVGSPSTVRLLPVEVRAEWRSPAGDAVRRRFVLIARR